MGTKDTITKDYMADNRVFADVFNHMLYKGKNIIDPDTLHPLDTTALAVPYGSGTSEVPVQKFRDEFKSLNVMHDDSRIYLLLGIENQSETHYAMPVKNMVYDALEYAGQVENSARSHREAKQWPSTSGEYLTGFYKDDRLIPVIPRSCTSVPTPGTLPGASTKCSLSRPPKFFPWSRITGSISSHLPR